MPKFQLPMLQPPKFHLGCVLILILLGLVAPSPAFAQQPPEPTPPAPAPETTANVPEGTTGAPEPQVTSAPVPEATSPVPEATSPEEESTAAPQSTGSTAADSKQPETTQDPGPTTGIPTEPPVKLDEEIEEDTPNVGEQVEGLFGKAVTLMDLVLFYRVGQGTQRFVQMNHLEYYVRDRKSSGPFEKLQDFGTLEPKTITLEQADAYRARDKIVLGNRESAEGGKDGKRRLYRLGEIGDRKVEYLTIIVDNESKYIEHKEDGKITYRKVTKKRSLLSTEAKDIFSEEDAKALAAKGWLKLDEDAVKDQSQTPFILSESTGGAPLVVLWLALGSVFFTIFMGGVNFWGFRHAVEVVRGKYDDPNEPGEVSHFQALSSALSATVGLGNISGVTIAMATGGPGAFFWMLFCGLFGMTSKFTESTLGQKYREVKPDGTVLGGPMQYLYAGLKDLGVGPLGMLLSVVFSIMCILASFGGGNMFQANQSGAQLLTMVQKEDNEKLGELRQGIREAAEKGNIAQLNKLEAEEAELSAKKETFATYFRVVFGLVFAALVGVVIIGGIKRIAAAASKVVPSMCLIYILACLYIIVNHITDVPGLIGQIFAQAFTGTAFSGGMLGVLVIGVQRAAFSNEAGVGSAAIAHSAAKTKEPVREGAVALLGPFIDTIVVCSMTALVILITGAWDNDKWIVDQGLTGVALTSEAFRAEINWFPYLLTVAVILFAYSTIISWSYYGERCWERLFGARSIVVYRSIYVGCVFLGTIFNLGAVLDFSDMMILSMAFPNILGLILLSPQVRAELMDYWRRYKAGEFKTFK